MSAIATSYVLAEADLPGLRSAAVPVPRLLRRPLDRFPGYLATHSRELPHLDASGFVLATAIPFLSGKGIELLPGAYPDLAAELQSVRHAHLMFFISSREQATFKPMFDTLSATTAELGLFYETFNEHAEPGIGEAMRRSIAFVASAVAAVPQNGVVLVCLS